MEGEGEGVLEGQLCSLTPAPPAHLGPAINHQYVARSRGLDAGTTWAPTFAL